MFAIEFKGKFMTQAQIFTSFDFSRADEALLSVNSVITSDKKSLLEDLINAIVTYGWIDMVTKEDFVIVEVGIKKMDHGTK